MNITQNISRTLLVVVLVALVSVPIAAQRSFYISEELNQELEKNYDEFEIMSTEGFVKVGTNGKYGFVNTHGKEIVPCKYDKAFNFFNGFARVVLDEKYGFINTNGEEIVPCIYDGSGNFCEGIAPVLFDKWGYINTNGEEVIPFKYYGAGSFKQGFAIVIIFDYGLKY